MAAATADRQYTDVSPGLLLSLLVKAATTIYKGTAVCVDATGYAVPGADTAGLIFVGWAIEQANNAAGASGDKAVRVKTADIFPMVCAGADQTWVGETAYLSDDQTVVITGATNNIRCGSVARLNSATEVEVKAASLFSGAEIAEFAAGSAALPSVHREGDTNTGMFWPGADSVALSCGGTARFTLSTTLATFAVPVVLPVGAVGAPSWYFLGSATSGMYQTAADELGIAIAGANVGTWDATGLTADGFNGPIGTVVPAAGTFTNVDVAGTFNFGQDPADLVAGFKEIGTYVTTLIDGFDHGSDVHLAVLWDITQVVGAGTNTVTVLDGWNQLVTGGAGGPDMESTRSNGLHCYAAYAPRIECVVELAAVAAGQTFFFGFWAAANRFVEIIHEPATGPNWLLRIDDTTGPETIDSGVAAVINTPTKLAIAIDAAGAPTWAIDDVAQDVAALTLVMANAHYIEWRILDVAAAAHTVAVDYFLMEQLKQQ